MKSTINKHRLNNLLRGIQTSIGMFQSQGHTDAYFTAQFYRGGRKQNGIERGDLQSFSKQVRTYIASEEADSARIEFFSERTGKSIYSKALNDLRIAEPEAASAAPVALAPAGLSGYAGLGEAQVAELVDRRVAEQRRADEFQRLVSEAEELRKKSEKLTAENEGGSKVIAFFPNRISLERLRSIWNDEDDHYADEQLLQIRDWLYTIAELSLSVIARQNSTSIPEENSDHLNDTAHGPNSFTIPVHHHTSSGSAAEESHSLHPRIHRRTG